MVIGSSTKVNPHYLEMKKEWWPIYIKFLLTKMQKRARYKTPLRLVLGCIDKHLNP